LPLTAQAYFCDTRSPLRSRSAPFTCSKTFYSYVPRPNGRKKKTEQHNVTKLKKVQQTKLLSTWWVGSKTGSASDQQSTNNRNVAGSRPSVYHSINR